MEVREKLQYRRGGESLMYAWGEWLGGGGKEGEGCGRERGGGVGRGERKGLCVSCVPLSGVSLDPSGWGIVVTSSTVLLWHLSGSKASCVHTHTCVCVCVCARVRVRVRVRMCVCVCA